jgi:hypothetical protein
MRKTKSIKARLVGMETAYRRASTAATKGGEVDAGILLDDGALRAAACGQLLRRQP